MPNAPKMVELWYAAIASEAGVCLLLEEGSIDLARAKLYKAREEACDPALKDIMITISPTTPNEIWLVRKQPKGSSDGET